MTGLPKFFQQTCDKPYSRHDYKLCYTTGKSEVYIDYELFRQAWWNTPYILRGHCEVLDKKIKQNTLKGFF